MSDNHIFLARRALHNTGESIHSIGEETTARILCEIALGIIPGFQQNEKEYAIEVTLEEIFSVNYHKHRLVENDARELYHRLQNGDSVVLIINEMQSGKFIFANIHYKCTCVACRN